MHPDRSEIGLQYAGHRSNFHRLTTHPIFNGAKDPRIEKILEAVDGACHGCPRRESCKPAYDIHSHINESASALVITGGNTGQEGCRVPRTPIPIEPQNVVRRFFTAPLQHIRR